MAEKAAIGAAGGGTAFALASQKSCKVCLHELFSCNGKAGREVQVKV